MGLQPRLRLGIFRKYLPSFAASPYVLIPSVMVAAFTVLIISARVLEVTEPNNMIIDPDLRVAVYVLQLRLMTQRGAQDWDVQAAWSYKDFFQRLDLEATQRDGRWVVTQKSVLDGNWPPAEKTEEKGS